MTVQRTGDYFESLLLLLQLPAAATLKECHWGVWGRSRWGRMGTVGRRRGSTQDCSQGGSWGYLRLGHYFIEP